MIHLKYFIVVFFFINANLVFNQTISGSLKFQSDNTNYTWTFVKMNGVKTQCDSLGKFNLKYIGGNDTLEIMPIPIFIKMKIYNFPKNNDTLQFDSIPLFKNINQGAPIINFKSKRATRKYFKKFEKEKQVEKEQLIERIRNNKYFWNGKEYNLEIVESEDCLTIEIDLGQ